MTTGAPSQQNIYQLTCACTHISSVPSEYWHSAQCNYLKSTPPVLKPTVSHLPKNFIFVMIPLSSAHLNNSFLPAFSFLLITPFFCFLLQQNSSKRLPVLSVSCLHTRPTFSSPSQWLLVPIIRGQCFVCILTKFSVTVTSPAAMTQALSVHAPPPHLPPVHWSPSTLCWLLSPTGHRGSLGHLSSPAAPLQRLSGDTLVTALGNAMGT